MTINKISLDFYFTNCTLDSENCKYWIKLNENTLDYCLVCKVTMDDNKKLENRYDICTINKSFISSFDLYEDANEDFIIRISVSGREHDIIIPFQDSEKAYNIYLQIKDWNDSHP